MKPHRHKESADGEGLSASIDEALAAVASLIDNSLLLRVETSVPTRPLYQILETVRAFAALELTAAGEREDALEGLAGDCIGEASRAAEGWSDRGRAKPSIDSLLKDIDKVDRYDILF